tara:strand:+ start:6537 stop:7802 length:1266 start_codon:yes stop_codon:yes gene_type:complete
MVRNVLVGVAMAVSACLLSACVDSSRDSDTPSTNSNPSDDAPPPEEFSIEGMLSNIATALIVPNYESLASTTAELASANGVLAEYCNSVGTAGEVAAKALAEDAWKSTMTVIQSSEMHALGPALENGSALRNRILSFSSSPLETCGVDEIAVLRGEPGFDLAGRALNQRGLGAVGYLLFNSDLDHTCPPQVPTTQDWNARTENSRKVARCEAALVIAGDVSDAADTLRDAWLPGEGNFAEALSSAENAGTNIQSMTDAMFYLETGVKDRKLGIPLGIIDACSSLSCPNVVEARYSEFSLSAVRANLEAFLQIFQGGEGVGFDDLIDDEGFPEVTQRFIENTNAAISLIDQIDTPLFAQASSIDSEAADLQCTNAVASPDVTDELSACTLYGLIKRITDDLKIDFTTIVNVMLPDGAQGDND